jgi:PAS domain S-box-containing protein
MNTLRLLDQTGEVRPLRLVGSSDAVAWVERVLTQAERLVESFVPSETAGPRSFGRGPVIWVARPHDTAPPLPVSETGLWTFPCLFVVRPDDPPSEPTPPNAAVESYDVVIEPDDERVLPYRVERLLLLHRRKTQTETVLHNLSDVIYTRKFDGTLTSINAAGERLFGRPRRELLAHRMPDLVEAGEVAADLMRKTNLEVQTRGRSTYRVTSTDREGRIRLFDSEALLLRDAHGLPAGVQVILSDITEEHENRERLQREARRNEILTAIASAARDSLDVDEVLPSAAEVLGTRLAAHTVQVWFLNEDRTACTLAFQWRALEETPSLVGWRRLLAESPAFSGLVRSLEPSMVADVTELPPSSELAELLLKLGGKSGVGVPIYREGQMMGILGLTFDRPRAYPPDELDFFRRVADQLAIAIRSARLYTNLQQQLHALAVAQRKREEADRDRSRLTAMLVHDLKSPLSAVRAALELTRDKVATSGDVRLAKMLDGSLASVRGLQGLVEDVLLVYRPEDAPEPSKSHANVGEVLGLPIEEIRWVARARRVTLDVDIPSALPAVALDAPRFRRAVANLLANAVKFSPAEGTVSLRAGYQILPEGPHLYVSVTDTGPGVPPSLRNQIATPYLRLPGSEAVPGTGLGLTVVQRVAQAHGGRVEVASNDGHGSVFTLWIPMKPARRPGDSDDSARPVR